MKPIPLRDPDGRVYAYACGECHHVVAFDPAPGGRLGRELVARRAERSRRRAARCCARPDHDVPVDDSSVELVAPAEPRACRPASGAELATRYGFKPMSAAEFAQNVGRELSRGSVRNAWRKSRLVTFLIRDLRYSAADEEWRRSVERLDRMESRASRDPWLARHVLRQVADEWLQHGQVDRARAVFRRISNSVVVKDPQLLELRQRLDDATEAVVLGESVYPACVPIHERWRGPRVLPEGQVQWMPGRVLAVDAQDVAFVVATPDSQRRVFKQRASVEDWTRWSGGSAPRVDMFFEIGFYGAEKDEVKVVEVRETLGAGDELVPGDPNDDEAPPRSAGSLVSAAPEERARQEVQRDVLATFLPAEIPTADEQRALVAFWNREGPAPSPVPQRKTRRRRR